ncbi:MULTISPECIES: AbrB/MazE/SpoVT family DNA-binding domain-containing protein [Pseudomonas syringae group]|uniref:SpoVT-AbrB domain-containing protein n=1 Tax=Pseudomonas amygdali pv. tabaci TaxID=322 RepID=A0A3M6GTB3_PSEAJ|nr:hypothetical protein ALP03_200276 [Pseudomonas amygdali pv. tabaci]
MGHWQEAGDGSGDIVVDIPPEIVDSLKLQVGDVLIFEVVDGLVTLKPKRGEITKGGAKRLRQVTKAEWLRCVDVSLP